MQILTAAVKAYPVSTRRVTHPGGTSALEPGLRPEYQPDYYGAFVCDPDGINVEAVCHRPE